MAIPNNADVQVANIAPPANAVTAEDLFDEPEIDPVPDSASPPPEKEIAQAAPPSPPPLPHSEQLIRAAREVGLSDTIIRSLPTDELLSHTLDLQRKLAYMASMDARRNQQPQQQVERQPAAPRVEESDDDILNHLEKEVGYDPKLIGMVRSLRKGQEEVKVIEAQRRQRDQNEAARRQISAEEATDDAFESLGPKAEKLYGKGPISKLTNQAHIEKRLAVAGHGRVDFQNDSERAINRKITKAHLAIYGDLLDAAPEPVNGKPGNLYEGNGKVPEGKVSQEEWDKAGLSRPSGVPPKKTRSGKAAVQAIEDRMREWGVGPGQRDDEYDGLPD